MDTSNKKNILSFGLAFLIVVLFFIWLIPSEVYKRLSFFRSNGYYYIVYISLIIGLVLLLLSYFNKINLKSSLMKIVYGLIFLPAIFFPIMRCYFKVPYIFCKACPRRCPWGNLRSVIVPSFLLLNINKRFWCFKMCSLGTLQDYQNKICSKRISLPKLLIKIRYFVLVYVIFVVIMGIIRIGGSPPFFKGDHHFYIWSFSIAIIIFILAFFIPRFWCNYICPIGSFSDIVLKIENKFKKKEL